jgi:hypothetical protein
VDVGTRVGRGVGGSDGYDVGDGVGLQCTPLRAAEKNLKAVQSITWVWGPWQLHQTRDVPNMQTHPHAHANTKANTHASANAPGRTQKTTQTHTRVRTRTHPESIPQAALEYL